MRRAALVLVAILSLAACGSGGDDEATSPTPASNTSASAAADQSNPPSPGADTSIVGEWTRTTTCQERVDALAAAGLGRFAAEHAAGEGWIPGVTSPDDIADLDHPCRGAEPVEHGHFFTADGLFGSRDDSGQQVDDGTYVLKGDDTVVIDKEFGEVTFHYSVSPDGTTLMLDPVLPTCAEQGCFDAQWAVAVAYPGLAWDRTG